MDTSERQQAILDAAAQLIIRHGYDKVTMGDVADAVGLSRGLVYVHFKSKEMLLEALIERELHKYGEFWLNYIETDPNGGSIGSVYRGVLVALQQTPFLAAIVTRDEGTFGKYLRKPDTLFASLQTPNLTYTFLQALKEAHAIREDVNIEAVAHIMDMLSAGLVASDPMTVHKTASYDVLLDTIAEMLDRFLTPEDGGDREAGKAVLHRFAAGVQEHFAQVELSKQDRNST
jgi:AcrR family transcriptional regulator